MILIIQKFGGGNMVPDFDEEGDDDSYDDNMDDYDNDSE